MRYAFLIALREYAENAKTKGFWIGIFMFPLIIGIASSSRGAGAETLSQALEVLAGSGLIPVFLVCFLLGYLLYAGIFLSIGSLSNELKEARHAHSAAVSHSVVGLFIIDPPKPLYGVTLGTVQRKGRVRGHDAHGGRRPSCRGGRSRESRSARHDPTCGGRCAHAGRSAHDLDMVGQRRFSARPGRVGDLRQSGCAPASQGVYWKTASRAISHATDPRCRLVVRLASSQRDHREPLDNA